MKSRGRLFRCGLARGGAFGKQEMQRRMHGRAASHDFRYLLERDVPDDEVLRLMAEKEEIYRELCLKDRERFHLAPGAVELLDWIKERRIPRTIATASEIVNVTFFIRSFGLERWFDPEKIVYDDGTLPGKPNPDIYLKAARTIGLLRLAAWSSKMPFRGSKRPGGPAPDTSWQWIPGRRTLRCWRDWTASPG